MSSTTIQHRRLAEVLETGDVDDVPGLLAELGHDVYVLDLSDLDPNLLADLEPPWRGERYEYSMPGATVANQAYHVVWLPELGRGGVVQVGSGSSGETFWTDAGSPDEAFARYLTDTLIP